MILQSLNQRKKDKTYLSEKDLQNIEYILCKTFCWSYTTLMETPIPFVKQMILHIVEENRIQKKEMDKINRKGKR